MPVSSPTAPNRPRRHPIAQSLFDDWWYLVRVSRPTDLEAVLRSVGYQSAEAALSARVVLQRLAPGLVAIARRRGGEHTTQRHQLLDDLLANAWIVIRRYPIDGRPTKVAANLLRDIEYQTFVRPARLRRVPTTTYPWSHAQGPDGEDDPPDTAEPSTHDRLMAVLVEARRRGMSDDDIRFALSLANGRTTDELAERLGLSGRAVRYRRERLVESLQGVVDLMAS